MALSQQGLSQQMQQFMLALQFQQQQAALQQAMNIGTQFGYAPGGNWMTWGQGGATQPTAGTDTLAALQQYFGQGSTAAGQLGYYNNPQTWTYQPGTYLRNAQTGQVGQVGNNGQLNTVTSLPPGIDQNQITTIDQSAWNPMLTTGGGGQGAPQTTQQAIAQQAALAGQQAQLTGMYQQPLGNIAQDAFQTKASPSDQATYLRQYGNDPAQAAAHYWQDVQGAISQSGLTPQQFVYGMNYNPAGTPTLAAQAQYAGLYGAGMPGTSQAGQQTLASQLQNAQLSGMYNGAPTQAYQAQGQQEAAAWAQLYGYTPQLDANGQPIVPGTGTGGTGTGGNPQTLASQLQAAQLSGMYNGAPTEAAREFNAQNALAQGQLGQQYLSTAAQLQGPQNTFQLSNYLRGAQGNPNVPVYLQNLQNNLGLPSFQAPGSTAPTPQSAAGLTSQMGYGVNGTPQYDANGQPITGSTSYSSATPGWDYNSTLNSINNIAQRGAQSLAPGSLERLSPDELSAFGSGLGAAGYSLPSFLNQYQNSRVGQQAGTGVMSFG